jgi:ureidoglycolate hydrolase
MTATVEALRPETFAPFGEVVGRPDRGTDAVGPGWGWWAEVGSLQSDGRPWTFGYLDLAPASTEFDWAERHMRTTEAILATSRDILVYVGPADHPEQPDRLPELDTFRVFRVPAGTGVILRPGVWHGAPLAPDGPTNAFVLLLEGTGAEDVYVVRFPGSPVQIQEGTDQTT